MNKNNRVWGFSMWWCYLVFLPPHQPLCGVLAPKDFCSMSCRISSSSEGKMKNNHHIELKRNVVAFYIYLCEERWHGVWVKMLWRFWWSGKQKITNMSLFLVLFYSLAFCYSSCRFFVFFFCLPMRGVRGRQQGPKHIFQRILEMPILLLLLFWRAWFFHLNCLQNIEQQ